MRFSEVLVSLRLEMQSQNRETHDPCELNEGTVWGEMHSRGGFLGCYDGTVVPSWQGISEVGRKSKKDGRKYSDEDIKKEEE